MTVSIGDDFDAVVDPYRRELLGHCYRMLGSVQDAEDLVQETLLRAWRSRDRYDASLASVRTWLHRIATNACLTALEGRKRRPLPSGLVAPDDDPDVELVPAFDIPWLQPIPDSRVDERGGLRLAFVAALQLLPARQRAVVVLREVLDYPAAEVATMLETTPAAVNSALQRARSTLGAAALSPEEVVEPTGADARAVVERYVEAFEAADLDRLTGLLTDEAILEMPPVPVWFVGRADYGRFIARVWQMRGRQWRMVAARANGQPAVAAYVREVDGRHHLHTLQVFTVEGDRVAHTVVFQDPGVFNAFGLAEYL